MDDHDSGMKRLITWNLLIGSVILLGIPVVVQIFWPKGSGLPPQVLSIPLQGLVLGMIFGGWIIKAWKTHHYGEMCILGFLLIMCFGVLFILLQRSL
jgi:hypothetical protein